MDSKLKAFILIIQIVNSLSYQVKVDIAWNNKRGLDVRKEKSLKYIPDVKGMQNILAKQVDDKPDLEVIQNLRTLLTKQADASANHTTEVDDSVKNIPDVETVQNILAKQMDDSINNLRHCGVAKILKCTAEVTKAIGECVDHPDVVQCIEEILGETNDCVECIVAICKILHIPGCE